MLLQQHNEPHHTAHLPGLLWFPPLDVLPLLSHRYVNPHRGTHLFDILLAVQCMGLMYRGPFERTTIHQWWAEGPGGALHQSGLIAADPGVGRG